jgi:hypothetical protein
MLRSISSDLNEFVVALKSEARETIRSLQQSEADGSSDSPSFWKSSDKSEAEEEALFRMGLPEVFTTPLQTNLSKDTTDGDDDDLREFLEGFDVNEKTDEISYLLESHETLREMFETLVPVSVPYVDFWQRFFYRCHPERIQRYWDRVTTKTTMNQHHNSQEQIIPSISDNIHIPNVIKQVTWNPLQKALGVLKTQLQKLDLVGDVECLDDSDPIQEEEALEEEKDVCHVAHVLHRQDLDELQFVIAVSNQRIANLQTKLMETGQKLENTESHAMELQRELEMAKAQLWKVEKQHEKNGEDDEKQLRNEDRRGINVVTHDERNLDTRETDVDDDGIPVSTADDQRCSDNEKRTLIENQTTTVQNEESIIEPSFDSSWMETSSSAAPSSPDGRATTDDAFTPTTGSKFKHIMDRSTVLELARKGLWGIMPTDEDEEEMGWSDHEELDDVDSVEAK